jgi:hypothetical protein
MKKQITRISVVQTSKVVALLYAIMSLLYTIIGVFMVVFGSHKVKMLGMVYVFMPILMLALGFLLTLLGCWLYNVVAKWVGGIEFTVEEK